MVGESCRGGKAEPPHHRASPRHRGWPAPPARRRSGECRVEGGRWHKVPRLAVLSQYLQRQASALRVPGRALTGSARAPAPGPVRSTELCALSLAAGLCGAHPALWPPSGDSLQTITKKTGGAIERDGDLLLWPRIPRRGNGGPRTESSLRPSRADAGPPLRQLGAPSPRSPGTRAGPRAPHSAQLPPSPLSSHFRGRRASWLRPRPAPERRPHSAAAGGRAP